MVQGGLRSYGVDSNMGLRTVASLGLERFDGGIGASLSAEVGCCGLDVGFRFRLSSGLLLNVFAVAADSSISPVSLT